MSKFLIPSMGLIIIAFTPHHSVLQQYLHWVVLTSRLSLVKHNGYAAHRRIIVDDKSRTTRTYQAKSYVQPRSSLPFDSTVLERLGSRILAMLRTRQILWRDSDFTLNRSTACKNGSQLQMLRGNHFDYNSALYVSHVVFRI